MTRPKPFESPFSCPFGVISSDALDAISNISAVVRRSDDVWDVVEGDEISCRGSSAVQAVRAIPVAKM